MRRASRVRWLTDIWVQVQDFGHLFLKSSFVMACHLCKQEGSSLHLFVSVKPPVVDLAALHFKSLQLIMLLHEGKITRNENKAWGYDFGNHWDQRRHNQEGRAGLEHNTTEINSDWGWELSYAILHINDIMCISNRSPHHDIEHDTLHIVRIIHIFKHISKTNKHLYPNFEICVGGLGGDQFAEVLPSVLAASPAGNCLLPWSSRFCRTPSTHRCFRFPECAYTWKLLMKLLGILIYCSLRRGRYQKTWKLFSFILGMSIHGNLFCERLLLTYIHVYACT